MTMRVPVAIWQDFAGAYTACVIDGPVLAAYDLTAAAALAQLKRYLAWAMRKGRAAVRPSDLVDLELCDYRLEYRPEYRVDETLYPVPTPVNLRVTCIHGKRSDGTLQCIAPTLGIRLSYQTGDAIKPLIVEAIKQALGRSTPRQLSRQLMPRRMTLDAIHLREHEPTRHSRDGRSPVLESVATLLSGKRRGRRAVRAIARDREVRLLVEQLTQSRANLLLLGDAGCGKSTVLAEAIRQFRRVRLKPEQQGSGEFHDAPSRRHFWRTSGQRLIAGMRYLGQWEERCEQVISELAETGSVLCVENLLDLVRVGGREPGGSVAAFFQAYLQRGELRIVAEANSAELDACRRLLPGLADLFQIVRIPEFSPVEARQVLDRLLTEGANHRKLNVEQGMADLIYRLYRRFQPYAAFPGRSAAFVRHLLERTPARGAIDAAEVLSGFQRETGLPERLLRDDMTLAHAQVLSDFRTAVLGQEAACQAAAGVVTTLKTGLNDPLRPLGVLFFCGPTGVGKTEMAKALARYLFGGSGATDRLLRLDMSEYAGPGATHRLMNSADGGPSEFIKQARRQPFAVVLLDEIEKASAEIHDALLGVLDEGRLTDRYGRVTTFRSAVIVMTSNLGAERSEPIGFDANISPPFERSVLERFRPEFVNRIDRIVTFAPLGRQTIAELVVRELNSLTNREGISKRNLKLIWTPEVVDYLADAGFDVKYGARPLHRALEQFVVAPLSRWLLQHAGIRNGVVSLTVDEEGVCFAPG